MPFDRLGFRSPFRQLGTGFVGHHLESGQLVVPAVLLSCCVGL
jgi:hypothetical protein